MHRKDFLKACTGALCGCAAAVAPARAAEPDDWRLPWVKERHAELLKALSQRMNESELAAALEQVGDFCARRRDDMVKPFAGDPAGFCREISKGHHQARHDPVSKVSTVVFTPDGDCYCPLNGVGYKTPGTACN